MKSYTDITQSKKLIELGIDVNTADMWWNTEKHYPEFVKTYHEHLGEQISPIPVWSLAALIEQLEDVICDEEDNQWELVIKKEGVQYDLYYLIVYGEQENIELDHFYDDLIDACVEMIVTLKEKNLL